MIFQKVNNRMNKLFELDRDKKILIDYRYTSLIIFIEMGKKIVFSFIFI